MLSWKNPTDGAWTDPTMWDAGVVPGSSDDVSLGLIGTYRVSLTASVSGHSVTISNTSASLVIANAGGLEAFSGDVANAGFLGIDSDNYSSEGGSSVTIAGTLTNTGQLVIGNTTNRITAATTLTTGALAGTGSVAIYGATGGAGSPHAELDVLSAAPGTLSGNLTVDGNATLRFSGGQIATIATGVAVSLVGPLALVADASDTTTNSALAGLTENDGRLVAYNGASVALTGSLTNTGYLGLDVDNYSSEGGSSLTIAGTLTNTGTIVLGPGTGGLSATTMLTVGALSQGGTLNIHGGTAATAPALAEVNVLAAAPGTLAGTTTLDGNALLRYAGGQIGTIGTGVNVSLNGAAAHIADASDTTTNSALTGLAAINGTLTVINGASVAVAGDLANAGLISLDGDGYTGEGGSRLTVAGTLTNTGTIGIGPYTSGLSAATILSVGALTGTGALFIHGSTAATAPPQAEVDVASAAPGTLAGNMTLDGNALLRYASGQIGTISTGVTLSLNGAAARIADASDTTTNSALTALAAINGTLTVINGASVAVAGDLANAGLISLDGDGYTGEGGSRLTVAGTLTNTGTIGIGPYTSGLSAATILMVGGLAGTGALFIHGSTAATAPPQAEVDVASAAPGTLVGNMTLDGNALLRYASGQIGTISTGVTLSLNGAAARIADASDTTTNSALAGLSTVNGTAVLRNGASIAAAGSLTVTGFLGLDSDGYTGEGGSSLTVAGTLTDTGTVVLGPSTGGLSAATTLTVGALAGTGQLQIHGSTAATAPPLATVDVLSAAPGTLGEQVRLDGTSLLSFASGQIGTVATGASLALYGTAAHVSDATDTTTNSALTGLSEIDGSVVLFNGASVAAADNLGVTGFVGLDSDGFTNEGGSSLTVAGTLTNSGTITQGPGTHTLSASDLLSVGALVNSGTINLFGASSTIEATLQSGATASNSGSIGVNAFSVMNVAGAFTQTAGSVTVGGGLVAASIALQGGVLTLQGGAASAAALTDAGLITSSGSIGIGASAGVNPGGAGGTLNLSGGVLALAGGGVQASGMAIGAGFVVRGAGALTGSIANAGVIEAQGGTLTVTGTVGGAGQLAIDAGATLELNGASAQSVQFNAASGTLKLDAPAGFTGSIGGFISGDTLDLANTTATGTTGTYSSATNSTTVVVSLLGGGTLSYALAGNYSGGQFSANQVGADALVGVGTLPDVAPTLSTPASTLAQQGAASAVAGIGIVDSDATTYNKTLTVTVADGSGTLTATTAVANGGGTITGTGGTSLTITGSLAQVNADLSTLTVTEAGLSADTITVSVIDGRGGSAGPQSIGVAVNAPAIVSAPTAITAPLNAATTIAGVAITDADAAGETISVSLSDAGGALIVSQAGAGATITGSGTGQLAISGTLAQVNAELATLNDTPTSPGGDTITITSDDGRGGGRSATISVTTPAPTPPVITAAAQVVGNSIESPIDGISVALDAGLAASTIVTVTLAEASGGLVVQHASGATVGGSATSISISGTAAQVNAALASLVYTGGATSIGITAAADGSTATRTIPVSLPASQNPSFPYEVPASILLQNSSSVVAAGGQTGNPGTAALLQWDQGGAAYVGTVYVNLPLVAGAPAEVGFAAVNSDTVAALLSATGLQEPFATVTGSWNVALGSASNLATDGAPVSVGTITDASPAQNDSITLTFHSQIDQQLPDRRLTVIFNTPGGTTNTGGGGSGGGGGGSRSAGDGGNGSDNNGGNGDGGDGNGDGGEGDGDVHLTTYKGLYYNFQAVGEFVLTRSTIASDPFQVQVRMQAWSNSAVVSVITAAAVQVGADRVTFDVNRTGVVWVNGAAVTLTPGGPAITLAAGKLEQLTPTTWKVLLHTGQTVTVDDVNTYLNVQTALRRDAVAGSVQGLLGTDSAATANVLTLPDGTTLSATPSFSDLYTSFANAWRITQATSLLDYGTGQTTATFTDPNFPADATPLSSLPASVVQNAQALVAAAGITDPAIAQGAILDYALTGDASFIASAAAAQGATQTVPLPDPANPTLVNGVGIAAINPSVTLATSGSTEVDFLVYRTSDFSAAQTVNYSVGTVNPGDLGAAYFQGGTLPSGQVSFAAGQSSATLALLLGSSLGTLPSGKVEVDLAAAAGVTLLASISTVTVDNNAPVTGTPAVPEILDPTGLGTFSNVGNAYTLSFGTIASAAVLDPFILEIVNGAGAGANTLFGTVTATGTGASFGTGLRPIAALDAGQVFDLPVTLNAATAGALDETLTFDANQRNASGYSASIGPVTLHITATVETAAVATLNTLGPIAFGNVHVGDTASQALSIANTAAAPATPLDASILAVPAGLLATGAITGLAPNATDTTSITVGLDTGNAGAKTGSVIVGFKANAGGGNVSTLAPASVAVSGAVYRLAAPSVGAVQLVVHVGDPGTAALTVANTGPADGYSEALIASLSAVSGGITGSVAGPAVTVAPGQSSTAIGIGFSTLQAGVITGTATVTLTSDGTGIDGLGQTVLPAITEPVNVTVDQYAQAAFQNLSAIGTLTNTGGNYTLNIGTVALGGAPVSIGIGVANAATGTADLLSGVLSASGDAAFTAQNLGSFAGLAAGQADAAPVVTLNTGTAGQFSETISLAATGSNASGYSAALAPSTLTITGTVAGLPAPVISALSPLTAYTSVATMLGPISITDANTGSAAMTVVVSDTTGLLSANRAGAATVGGAGTNRLVLTGSLADVNAELASLTYTTALTSGSDSVSIALTDGQDAAASGTQAITIQPVPNTAPIVQVPGVAVLIPGQQNGIGGLNIVDPYASATGQQVTLTISSSGPVPQTYLASGAPGATVTGQGTGNLTITGTVAQVNSYLSDGITESILQDAYAKAQKAAAKAGEQYGTVINLLNLTKGLIDAGLAGLTTEAVKILEDGTANAYGTPTPPDPGKTLVQVDVGLFSFAANVLNDVAAIAGGATSLPPPAGGGGGEPHLITYDGLSYQLEAAGEFLLAGSTSPGNSFTVEARFQPVKASTVASQITQIGAMVGTDRVTIDATRAAIVYLNGAALAMVIGTSVKLNGGQMTELSSGVYQITWNTGETLTVTDEGSFLNTNVGLGANDTANTVNGLLGPNNGQANVFTLPDGRVLPQPITAGDINLFLNAWRIPQAGSILDYAPGQTSATFTNTGFATQPLTLADLPASVVAQAAQVVAAYGITDPTAAAAAEFDYITSGGDPSVIAADQALYQGITATALPITRTGPAPAALGIIATTATIPVVQSGPTQVTFEVYLTAAAAQDTVVAYAVVAADATDLNAAAFGGTLPSGQVTIAAGQTSAQISIQVPQGALGSAAVGTVQLAITSPGGTPLLTSNARSAVVAPAAGAPAVFQLAELTPFGTFIRDSSTSYTLDLGAVQYGESLPVLNFAITNAATAPSDNLTAGIAVASVEGFTASGTTMPGALAGGQSYTGLTATINTIKFGANVETITFTPVDSNASGYSAPQTPVTLTILDTLEFPTITYSEAWGDVHIVTYNGLKYDFQGVGEYWLAESHIPGDTFGIQLRLQPFNNFGAAVSIITEVAVSLGTDRVTFDQTHAGFVWVNGAPTTLSMTQNVLSLAGGTVTEITPSTFRVNWTTGEQATITEGGIYINVVDGVPPGDLAGGVGGLQGAGEGQSNDFQLPDGTVLPQPLTMDTLYNVFGNAWRVSQATSLFDYAPGQTTATFTDPNYPKDAVTLASLPAALVAKAAQMVAAAGITDPIIAQAAELDYLATGDPSFINSAQVVQQTKLVSGQATATPTTAPAPAAGVAADQASVIESATGTTAVVFDVYLTAADTVDVPITYQVIASGSGALDAASFGGTLPSGSLTIAAGQTTGQFTVQVPQGALGTLPSESLQVQISTPNGEALFAPTAQAQIINPAVEPGPAAVPQLIYLGTTGTFRQNGNIYSLDLTTVQDQALAPLQFGIVNTATAPADLLSGTFGAPTGSGFTVTGNALPGALAAGQSYVGLYFATQTTTLGSSTETIVFHPRDVNSSGYSAALPDITLIVTDPVLAQAQIQLNTPATVILPNVRVGAVDTQGVSVTNTATAPAANLDVTPLASAGSTASGSVTGLAPGATDHSSLSVGVGTATAGAQSGTVTLLSYSDASGTKQPLATSPLINVFGSVYRTGVASVTASAPRIVHVGDSGAVGLEVTNTAVTDGYSEGLIASVSGTTPGLSAVSTNPTGTIAAGASDGSLAVQFSTATAGTYSGTATIGLTSDGGTGAGSVDGLGQFALAPATVGVGITVDHYAQASLSATVGGVAATIVGTTLNLGTVRLGSGPLTIGLTESNVAAGLSDLLAANFLASGGADFTNALTPVSRLAAGQGASAGTISFATDTAGTFSETINATPTGSNASEYSGALAPQTLTITGTVSGAAPPPTPSIAFLPPEGGPAAQKAIINTPNPVVSGATAAGAAVALQSAGADAGGTTSDGANGYYQTATSAGLPQGFSSLTASASNAGGTSGVSAPASAFEIASPVAGISTADFASITFGHLFDAGYVLQFSTGTEAADVVDGVLSVGPDTTEAYVQRLYEGLFGRGSEATGMTYWDHLLQQGVSKETIALGFLTSPEFLTHFGPASAIDPTHFITILYSGLLGRAPTTGDMGFWTGQVASAGQAAVLQGIADSPEAKAHLAATTAQVWSRNDAGTLTHELFETGLGREVELTPGYGLEYWKTLLTTATTQQALALFVATPEFMADHGGQDNATYVKSLFDAGLGRDPNSTEQQPLVAALQSGAASRADILLQVATSPGAVLNLTRNL